MFHLLDRIMNLDIGNRGVEHLYEPARARNAEALCAAAARPLTAVAAGECVILITGSLTRAWVSPKIGETDGPVGVAALARALSYGFNAIPVVVSDTSSRSRARPGADSPMAKDAPPGWGEKVLYARLALGDTALTGGDVPPQTYERPRGISVRIGASRRRSAP